MALKVSSMADDAGLPPALANGTFQPFAVVIVFSTVLSARSFISLPLTADVTVMIGASVDSLLIWCWYRGFLSQIRLQTL